MHICEFHHRPASAEPLRRLLLRRHLHEDLVDSLRSHDFEQQGVGLPFSSPPIARSLVTCLKKMCLSLVRLIHSRVKNIVPPLLIDCYIIHRRSVSVFRITHTSSTRASG